MSFQPLAQSAKNKKRKEKEIRKKFPVSLLDFRGVKWYDNVEMIGLSKSETLAMAKHGEGEGEGEPIKCPILQLQKMLISVITDA